MREQDAKSAMELAKKYPMPQQDPAGPPGMKQDAQKAAQKPPQGNHGNQARKSA
jgi:hypothetical protein